MIWIPYILSAWLAADVATGVFHWWEDRYGNPDWPILGPFVVTPNIVHHSDQRAFLAGGYWSRNWTTILPAAIVCAACLASEWWWWALVAAFASQANEVHGWAHQRGGRVVRGLQLLGVLCSPDGHARHHRAPFASDFCVMTDWANPLLSAVGFWPALEAVVACFGVRPRPERGVA